MKKYYIIFAALLAAATSCEKFLDTMPDNRAKIDSQEKIQKLLVSAYPDTDYMLLTEFLSDNVDDFGKNNPNTDRFIDQVYAWEDITESNNESPERLWENSYIAIAAANEALDAIERMGGAEAAGLYAEQAEALLCRAYNHFILANVFCMAYDPETAEQYLGIPYIMEPEKTLSPHYDRGSVKDVYDKIGADIAKALPHVSDEYYTVPKYHFNAKAAYAFAARFYLYHYEFDKSIEYANKVLGEEPSTMLRDWEYQSTMTQDYEVIVNHYVEASLNCNLLLMTAYSNLGLAFGPYRIYSRYAHGQYLAERETGQAICSLWGGNKRSYWMPMKEYSATNLEKYIFWRLPYLFEYTDPVAQIGYRRTAYPAFSGDMTLLERAEALVLKDEPDYDAAARDLNIYVRNIANTKENTIREITVSRIEDFFGNMKYCTWDASTIKKHLNPSAALIKGDDGLSKEGSRQENMLQCVLAMKRLESLGSGLRWFDVKRYRIEIDRRIINSAGVPGKWTDKLEKDDLRRASQIPPKVVSAGLKANPRNN